MANDLLQTFKNHTFDPKKVKVSQIDIEDIAHALSNICRYGGHCIKFYSVAEHSILTYKIAKKKWPQDLEVQWACLLHDATEAYITDIPTPLKKLMGNFNEMESLLHAQINEHFNIKNTKEIKNKVKEVDLEALATEATLLFYDHTTFFDLGHIDKHHELLGDGFPQRSGESKYKFLECFRELDFRMF